MLYACRLFNDSWCLAFEEMKLKNVSEYYWLVSMIVEDEDEQSARTLSCKGYKYI